MTGLEKNAVTNGNTNAQRIVLLNILLNTFYNNKDAALSFIVTNNELDRQRLMKAIENSTILPQPEMNKNVGT